MSVLSNGCARWLWGGGAKDNPCDPTVNPSLLPVVLRNQGRQRTAWAKGDPRTGEQQGGPQWRARPETPPAVSPHRWVPPAWSVSSLALPRQAHTPTRHSARAGGPGPFAVLTGSDRVVRHRQGVARSSLRNTRGFLTQVLAAPAATLLPCINPGQRT